MLANIAPPLTQQNSAHAVTAPFDGWVGDWLDAQQTRVVLGKLNRAPAEDFGKLLNRYVLPEPGAMAKADVDAPAIDQFMARLSERKTPTVAPQDG